MGSAFSFPCIDRKHDVSIVGTHLEDNFIDEINKNKLHPSLNVKLSDKIKILKYNDFENIINEKIDLIVIAVSSKGINWVADQLTIKSKEKKLPPILLLTKGIGIFNNNYESLSDKLNRLLINNKFEEINISAVAGPCLAKDLAKKTHTNVIFVNKNIQTINWLIDNLKTNYYYPFLSNDLIGVEVCAAIKNIFSMVLGISKGMNISNKNTSKENYYLNTSAALMRQSLYEMDLFVNRLNGLRETVYGLAGLGDLYVSAAGGRNSKMGTFMGEGYTFSEAKKMKMPNETIEAVELINEIGIKVKNDFHNNELPLMIGMIDAILDNKKFIIEWDNFN